MTDTCSLPIRFTSPPPDYATIAVEHEPAPFLATPSFTELPRYEQVKARGPSDGKAQAPIPTLEVQIARSDLSEVDTFFLSLGTCCSSSRVFMDACKVMRLKHFSMDSELRCLPRLRIDGLPHPASFPVIARWFSDGTFPPQEEFVEWVATTGDQSTRRLLQHNLVGLLENSIALQMCDSFWAAFGTWMGSAAASTDSSSRPHGSSPHAPTTTSTPSASQRSSFPQPQLSHIMSALQNRLPPTFTTPTLRKDAQAEPLPISKLWTDAVIMALTSSSFHHADVPLSFLQGFLRSSSTHWVAADRLSLILWWARVRRPRNKDTGLLFPPGPGCSFGADGLSVCGERCTAEAIKVIEKFVEVGDVPFHAASRIRDLMPDTWEAVVGGLFRSCEASSS
ncbi:hypothetical protein HDU96_002738 [Phlyctochytrium bullatum]|nr:hypothetical protein HDU96_002738 [Phlyctochytrium bullatum]